MTQAEMDAAFVKAAEGEVVLCNAATRVRPAWELDKNGCWMQLQPPRVFSCTTQRPYRNQPPLFNTASTLPLYHLADFCDIAMTRIIPP